MSSAGAHDRGSITPYTDVSVLTANHTPPRSLAVGDGSAVSSTKLVDHNGFLLRQTCPALPWLNRRYGEG